MCRGRHLYQCRSLVSVPNQELFGHGIFASNGAHWKAHREFAKTLFTPDHLRTTVPVFERHARTLVSCLEKKRTVDMQVGGLCRGVLPARR